MRFTFFLILFNSIISYSQTQTITGAVFNKKDLQLESANIIAKPLTEKTTIKFAISDIKDRMHN